MTVKPVLVNADVIAKMVNVTRALVERWGREGKIPRVVISRKVVRFDPEKVMQAIRRLEQA